MKNRIRVKRDLAGWSQEDLAVKVGTSQQRISQIENQMALPDAAEISKLMKAFECRFEDLFVDEKESEGRSGKIGLLITYIPLPGHVDPNFTRLTYGDSGSKARFIRKVIKLPSEDGYYVFFHTTIDGKRYITGYFYVDKVLAKGIDDQKIAALTCDAKVDDVILIGDWEESKILIFPLPLDQELTLNLETLRLKPEDFNAGRTELQVIASKTRPIRVLSGRDVDFLLAKCKNRG